MANVWKSFFYIIRYEISCNVSVQNKIYNLIVLTRKKCGTELHKWQY